MQPGKSGDPYAAASLVERQMLLRDMRGKAAAAETTETVSSAYRFVTLSRDIGSLGDSIARELEEGTGWCVHDKEILDYVARNSHVRQSIVEQLDERDQNLVHETVRRLLRMMEGGSFGMAEYREALLRSLVALAAQGRTILVGRGANFALRHEKHGLHVRITASAGVRAQRLSLRWHVSPAEARWRMQEIDGERQHFVRRHYRQNLSDPCGYDLVFNTDFLTSSQVVKSIMNVLGSPAGTKDRKGPQVPLRQASMQAQSA